MVAALSFNYLFGIERVRRPLVILISHDLLRIMGRLLFLYSVDASFKFINKLVSGLSSLLTWLLRIYSLIYTRIITHHKWVLFVGHSSHCIVFYNILWTTHKSILSIVTWPLVIRHVLAHHLFLVYLLTTHRIFTDLLMVSVRGSAITDCLDSLTLALILDLASVVSLLDLNHLGLIRFAGTWSCKVIDLLVLCRVVADMVI